MFLVPASLAITSSTSHSCVTEPHSSKLLTRLLRMSNASFKKLSSDGGSTTSHLSPRLGLVQVLLLSLIVFLVLAALQRRYFSPVSDIPGPFISSISGNLWHLLQVIKGHPEAELIELHKKHGIFVRIGYNEIDVSHTDVVDKVLSARFRKVRNFVPPYVLTLPGHAEEKEKRDYNQ